MLRVRCNTIRKVVKARDQEPSGKWCILEFFRIPIRIQWKRSRVQYVAGMNPISVDLWALCSSTGTVECGRSPTPRQGSEKQQEKTQAEPDRLICRQTVTHRMWPSPNQAWNCKSIYAFLKHWVHSMGITTPGRLLKRRDQIGRAHV